MLKEKNILYINNQGDPASLHPHTGVDLVCRNFQKALFEGLTRMTPFGTPELAGAKHIEISPSKLQYTFTLRPMNWNNGERVSATHFENGWKAAIAPNSDCLRSDLFYLIKNAEKAKKGEISLDEVGIRAVNEYTLVIDLEHPAPYFLDLISNSIFSPLYDDAKTPSIFNGPFNVKTWKYGDKLIFEKNPTYWDADSVQLDTVEISLVDDPNTAMLMYERGQLDWIGHPFTMLSQESIAKVKDFSNFVSKPVGAVFRLYLNTEIFPLNSKKIRRALSTVLDREVLTEHVIIGEVPTKSLLATTMTLVSDDEIYSDSDEKLARNLFEEGLRELSLTYDTFPILKYSHANLPEQKKLAEAIKERWERTFGIRVDLIPTEWNVFVSNQCNKQFQIGGTIGFSMFNDPVYTLDFFRNKIDHYNFSQWESEQYRELLNSADSESDPLIRRKYLKQAELLILDEMPVVPIYAMHAKYLKSPKVKGLFVNDLGQADLKWTYLEQVQASEHATSKR